MGAGIAALIAGTGIPVVMLDIVPKKLSEDEILKGVGKDDPVHLNRLAQIGKDRISNKKIGALLMPEMADYIVVGNLETDLTLLRDCDWIVEVVAENLEIKQALFQKLAPYIKKDAIISTNTSGIPVSQIAEGMPEKLQERFLGTHFFNPPRYMRLIEIIPTEATNKDIIEYMRKFCHKILGKGVVVARDTPNFIGNRIGSYGLPNIYMLMEKYGFDIEKVDYLTGKLIGRPKSATFRTADLVGLDVLTHVNDNLAESISDEKEKELFVLPDTIYQMVEKGQLGNKTGKGFYKKITDKNGKKTILVWEASKNDYVPIDKVSVPFIETVKKNRRLKDRLNALVYSEEPEGRFLWEMISGVLLYSAEKAPQIANTYEDIDKAMKWGYNWEVGPFEIWNLIGFEKAAAKMKAEGKALPQWIEERLVTREPFYEKDPDIRSFKTVYSVIHSFEHTALLDMGDGVVGVEFSSPGDSITAQVRKELASAIDEVEQNNAYVGLVLLNSGANFLTGADLKEMVTALFMQKFDLIESSVTEFQNVSLKLKYARKPVVAAIHGRVLGGGCEYAMHCSRVVAHVDTYMGLVEVGVGLIPGGGGMKELVERSTKAVETYGYNDAFPVIQKYLTQIATAKVSMNAFQALEFGYLQSTDKIIMQLDDLATRAKEEVLQMVKDGYRQRIPQLTKVTGRTGYAAVQIGLNAMVDGGFATEHDRYIALKAARVLTGGDVSKGRLVSEKELMRLELEGFSDLLRNKKTHERIVGMVETRKPVRN